MFILAWYIANSVRQGRAGVPRREALQRRQRPGLAGADGAHGHARVGRPLRRAGREGVLPLQE